MKAKVQSRNPVHSFSRVLNRLQVLHDAAGEALQYAPQSVGIAFTSFSVLFKLAVADVDLCDTISDAVDVITYWIFVGELYVKHYDSNAGLVSERDTAENNAAERSTEQDNNNTLQGIKTLPEEVRQRIPDLFAVVLQFCFEVEKLKFEYHSKDPEGNTTMSGKRIRDHIRSGKNKSITGLDWLTRSLKSFLWERERALILALGRRKDDEGTRPDRGYRLSVYCNRPASEDYRPVRQAGRTQTDASRSGGYLRKTGQHTKQAQRGLLEITEMAPNWVGLRP